MRSQSCRTTGTSNALTGGGSAIAAGFAGAHSSRRRQVFGRATPSIKNPG
ncbi:MYXO-CTERM sorting domain-containing protein [Nocardia altamirensis]